jgi:hypothetical protein
VGLGCAPGEFSGLPKEDHNIAPPRVAPLGEVAGRERHFQIVSELADEPAVAGLFNRNCRSSCPSTRG